ncbi:Uma2 family endonuclease [Anabaena aphanizomenioides LEGE 00250]|uniref:Uma2 family endonuclease n=1 Tax=Sphaerospermopsis aphanizomenoides LEGE 00250 TaxID=2777972 RepID=A0ABR9VGG2_9CYAN|nr:Uma2 family endonuclease [Sphaerospermopsis aphanizomenoides]MBE9236475.1 Uma2 family endonuclease [Sphaerospermopsis aphanizomenoides LEGE 00250]
MQLTQKQYYTPEEYLELEATAEYKSEYIEGQIIPIAGASINHNRITGNFYAELNFAFRQQDKYEVFNSDIRLWIPQKLIYTYPDVMIIADEPEFFNNRKDTITNPQVIIEVLSKSTKGYDREDKFAAYRTIPNFQEYLLIDQTRIHVEQFSKTGKKRWNLFEYDEEDENISLVTVPLEISLQNLYNKVKFGVVESELENNS